MSVDPEAEWGPLSAHRWFPDEPGQSDPEDDETEIEIETDENQEELEYESIASSSMTVPGQGEPGPNCESWRPFEFCDKCGEPRMGMSRCDRRSCPNCFRRWEKERTIGGVQRLAKGRYAEDDGIDRRVIHASVSPPQGDIQTLNEWYDGYRQAYQLAKSQGIRGGVAIGHGFRVTDSTKTEYRHSDPDKGVWRWIRDDLPESWRHHTYWSPHYHIIGLCRDLADNKPAQQDGWTCCRLDSLDPYSSMRDREGISDMVRRFRYVLDHSTFESGTSKDCVRWFGSLATTQFQPSQALSEGAESVIERVVEEVVGSPPDQRGDGDESVIDDDDDDVDERCGNCGGTSFSSIFEAGAALMDKGWCKRIGSQQQRRLSTAFGWVIGEQKPPPGLQNPSTEAEAEQAFQELLD